MNYVTASLFRRNRRAFAAALLSYLLIAGQTAPLVLASASRTAAPGNAASQPSPPAGESPSFAVTAAAPAPAPLAPAAAALAPTITATKVDTVIAANGIDPDPDGIADPDQLIEYQVTITNTGTQATNVTFNDTVDVNTTIQAGTARSTPLAGLDSYNVMGNVRIQVPDGASDLLSNDQDPDTGNNTGMTAVAESKKSVQCVAAGASCPTDNVTINADGSFSYNPPPGYTGADSFTYTPQSAGDNGSAGTVNLTVGPTLVWFIDNDPAAPAGNDGRLTSPFNSIAAYNASTPTKDANDIVFIYQGTSAYTGNLTLTNGMKLIGQGASLAAEVPAPPPHSDALPGTASNPTVNSTSGDTVTLAQNNTIRGLTLNDSAGLDITGAGFGTLTVSAVTLSGTGRPLFLNNGTLAATFTQITSTASTGGAGINLLSVGGTLGVTNGTGITDPSAECVLVTGSTVTANFGNTTCSDATNGISLANNASGTRTFGTLSVTGGTGAGFLHSDPDGAGAGATGGGATTVGATTITNPGGVGIDIDRSNADISFGATIVSKNATGIGVDLTENPGRTIGFTSLAVTTTNSFALNANNSGTVNAGGGSLTQNGAGGGAASLVNTTLGLNFTSVSSTSGGNGVVITNGTGTFTTGTTSLTTIGGAGILMTGSGVAANFGNTTVNGSTGASVSLTNNTAAITFADLDLTPTGTNTAFSATGNSGTITSTSGDITAAGTAISITGPGGRTPLSMTLNNVDSTASTTFGVDLSSVSGSLTVNDPGIATNIVTTAGVGIRVRDSGAGTINFGDTSVTGTGTTAVVLGTAGLGNNGNVTFPELTIGVSTASRYNGAGVSITDGASGATDSLGVLNIFANNAAGLSALNFDGTLNVTSGTVDTGSGASVNIDGPANLTTLGVSLTKVVSLAGTTPGITVRDTNGSFAVVGTGGTCSSAANCTGGSISNKTGTSEASGTPGVRLFNVTNFSLTRVNISGNNHSGIYAGLVNNPSGTIDTSKINGFQLDTCNITNNGDTVTSNPDEVGVDLYNVIGSAAGGSNPTRIINSTITNNEEFQVQITNESGTLTNFQLTNNTLSNLSGAPGGEPNPDGIVSGNLVNFIARNTAVMTLNTSGGTYTGNAPFTASGIQCDVSSGTNFCNVTGGTFTNNNVAVNVTQSGAGTLNFKVDGITATGNRAHGLNLFVNANSTGPIHGRFLNNIIGTAGVVGSGSSLGNGIRVQNEASNTSNPVNLIISGNNVREVGNPDPAISASAGIRIVQGISGPSITTSKTTNATITGNTVSNINESRAIVVQQNASTAGSTGSTCVDISGNTMTNIFGLATGPSTGDGSHVRLLQLQAATFLLRQTNAAGVAAANPPTTASQVSIGGTMTPTASACPQPAAAAPSGPAFFETSSISASSVNSFSGDGAQSGAPATSMGGGVTSQPFVSLPRGTTQTTTAQPVNTLAPVAQPQQAAVTTVEPQGTLIEAANVTQINPPVVSSSNINWNLGTLEQGQSVTITFRVKVNNPYTGGANVSNQGTVTCTECSGSVSTDDPAVAGAADATLTPINAPPNIVIKDASGPEPESGSAPMAFTVVLSKVSAVNVTVNFTTADDTPGTGKAVAGADYTSTNGSLTFLPGQTVQTISVPILADASSPEPDETFFVNLTGATGGNITDNQAVGTITAANPPGAILISEIRTFGPGGAGDDFVEIYNNTGAPHTVTASDASAGYGIFRLGATCAETPVLIGTIPSATVIPARGHFLLVGSQYGLGAVATGNLTMSSDLGENANVGIFSTDNVANLSTATRLDAVGFAPNSTGNNCDLLREGGILPQISSATPGLGEHSFTRSLCSFVNGVGCTVANPGFPEDRNNNSTDFLFVDTNATNAAGTSQQRLGAPGPENMASARVNDNIGVFLLDGTKSSTAVPNRVRKQCATVGVEECDPDRSKLGTMALRKKFVNSTGVTVTQLRVRIAEITTKPWAGGAIADVRALSSTDVVVSGITDAATCAANGTPATVPCSVTVKGTTVQAPTQVLGGGYNATMLIPVPGGGLLNGQTVSLQFLLGVQESGSFRFLVNVEALP